MLELFVETDIEKAIKGAKEEDGEEDEEEEDDDDEVSLSSLVSQDLCIPSLYLSFTLHHRKRFLAGLVL